MAELDTIYETKIKYTGLFSFNDLYNLLYDFLTDYNYFVTEEGYTEKVRAEGKEIEVKWLCLKKVTDYFRYRIKITMRLFRLLEVEITKEGKKVKMNKGDLEIKFTAILERDYENKFEISPFHKFLRAVYEKYIIKNRIEQMEDKLVEETLTFVNNTKAYLELEAKK
jgi:hypothetical protein